jgi:hypothetical protein
MLVKLTSGVTLKNGRRHRQQQQQQHLLESSFFKLGFEPERSGKRSVIV